MPACELSTSMAWARVVRGSNSIAKEVILRSRSALTRSGSACGCMKPITMLPSRKPAMVSSEGGCTASSTSARASAAAAVASTSTSGKIPSGWFAPLPAPASMTTCAPRALSFFATSGDSATRRSLGARSRSATTVTVMSPSWWMRWRPAGCRMLPHRGGAGHRTANGPLDAISRSAPCPRRAAAPGQARPPARSLPSTWLIACSNASSF